MESSSPHPPAEAEQRLRQLEDRLTRLEAYVGLDPDPTTSAARPDLAAHALKSGDELELEVGQNWFGPFGITALAVGGGFMLTLPYPHLPPALPASAGLLAAVGLFLAAHFSRRSFTVVAGFLDGAAMALLYCATLRLFFFGAVPTLPADGAAAPVLLSSAAAVNVWLAWRWHSLPLMILALLTACATGLAVGTPASALLACATVTLFTAGLATRGWRWLLPVGMAIVFTTYLLWVLGNPVRGGAYHWAAAPVGAPLLLLLCMAAFGLAPWLARNGDADDRCAIVTTLLNTGLGYGLFLVHTYAVRSSSFALWHVLGSTVLLGLAAAWWLRHHSQVSTFLYAMCGYAALAAAALSLAPVPELFVWLSLESLVVVGTAIWFRSRFIVVANFLVFGVVVCGYMLYNSHESGVSIGLGAVALISARVLNWQRHRLALQTELMRNVYLVSAVVIFPYALLHLAGPRFTALSWVALAAAFYALNWMMENQKYRLMGHATLLFTLVYLAIPSHPGLTTAYRITSFLALGAALLVVSLTTSARARRCQRAGAATQCESTAVGSDAGLSR